MAVPRRRVVIESPFAARPDWSVESNIDYARQCMRNSILRGEAPIASHLLYTQPGILDDNIPEERALGIECGLIWAQVGSFSVFYTDHGWSSGMLLALHNHNLRRNYPFRIRSLEGKSHVRLPTTLDEDIENLLRAFIED